MLTLKQDLSGQDANIRAKIKDVAQKLEIAPDSEKPAFQKAMNDLLDERDDLLSLRLDFAASELNDAASAVAKAALELRRNALKKIMEALADTLKSIRKEDEPSPVLELPPPPPPPPKQEPEVEPAPEPATPTTSQPDGFDGPHIVVMEEDVEALARVVLSEVGIFANYGEEQLEGGAAAVIDTIFNRVIYPTAEFPKTIQAAIDQPAQFSAINKKGTWKNLPEPTNTFRKMVETYIKARAAGAPSKIMGATHFLNPNSASQSALDSWGNYLVEHKVAWYGRWGGKFIHYHGFSPGYSAPPVYALEYKGIVSFFEGTGLPMNLPKPETVATGGLLPTNWKPAADLKRIITHWTGGGYKASGLDRHHYHILIEADGNIVRGNFSIKANEKNLVEGQYAAHTLGTNTGSIGVSVCCMAGAEEKPFDAGGAPLTKVQWGQLIRVVAELCKAYSIEISPTTVLGHGEVQENLGHKQKGKWDPMVLPWNTALSHQQVGALFRDEVAKLL